MLDDVQLAREYQRFTMHHSNPPSFATWLAQRRESDAEKVAEFLRQASSQQPKGKT